MFSLSSLEIRSTAWVIIIFMIVERHPSTNIRPYPMLYEGSWTGLMMRQCRLGQSSTSSFQSSAIRVSICCMPFKESLVQLLCTNDTCRMQQYTKTSDQIRDGLKHRNLRNAPASRPCVIGCRQFVAREGVKSSVVADL